MAKLKQVFCNKSQMNTFNNIKHNDKSIAPCVSYQLSKCLHVCTTLFKDCGDIVIIHYCIVNQSM